MYSKNCVSKYIAFISSKAIQDTSQYCYFPVLVQGFVTIFQYFIRLVDLFWRLLINGSFMKKLQYFRGQIQFSNINKGDKFLYRPDNENVTCSQKLSPIHFFPCTRMYLINPNPLFPLTKPDPHHQPWILSVGRPLKNLSKHYFSTCSSLDFSSQLDLPSQIPSKNCKLFSFILI